MANREQLGQNMVSLFQHISMGPFSRDPKKKENFEPEPLYVELYPPPPPKKREEDKEECGVVIIELW